MQAGARAHRAARGRTGRAGGEACRPGSARHLPRLVGDHPLYFGDALAFARPVFFGKGQHLVAECMQLLDMVCEFGGIHGDSPARFLDLWQSSLHSMKCGGK